MKLTLNKVLTIFLTIAMVLTTSLSVFAQDLNQDIEVNETEITSEIIDNNEETVEETEETAIVSDFNRNIELQNQTDEVTFDVDIDFSQANEMVFAMLRVSGHSGGQMSIQNITTGETLPNMYVWEAGLNNTMQQMYQKISKPNAAGDVFTYRITTKMYKYIDPSEYKFTSRNYNDFDRALSGIENATNIEKYDPGYTYTGGSGSGNYQNGVYVPSGEHETYYKFTAGLNDRATLVSTKSYTQLGFRIKDTNDNILYDSANDVNAIRTTYKDAFQHVVKKDNLSDVCNIGQDYYFVVYNNQNGAAIDDKNAYRFTVGAGYWATKTTSSISSSASLTSRNSSTWSSTGYFSVTGVPKTAVCAIITVGRGGQSASNVAYIRTSKNLSTWKSTSRGGSTINYRTNVLGGSATKLEGSWGVQIQSGTTSSVSTRPTATFEYYYEIGDIK